MSAAIDICSLERWNRLCRRLGLSADGATYDELIKAHAEKHRAYHRLDHIAACLRHLDDVRDQAERPDEIEMALWFHDAVYKPLSATNEEDSADWAEAWLVRRGADASMIARITDHILDTKSHDAPDTIDGQIMLDIDLSILGTPAHIYDEYEQNIRFEYRRVPKFIYRKKRSEVLRIFLSRNRIYATGYFHDKFERQARNNLSRAISSLN